MPTYQYSCTSCDSVVEVTRSLSEKEVVPECCEGPTKRVWNATPSVFKGSGWGKVYGTYKPKGNGLD